MNHEAMLVIIANSRIVQLEDKTEKESCKSFAGGILISSVLKPEGSEVI
jgi:hypothetical protein